VELDFMTQDNNSRFSPEHLQVLTHFYRGEVQRATDWRKRLDTTTNWAIIATTATFSWTFGTGSSPAESHLVFFFTNMIVFLLLCIEARRFRFYDVWHTRVRMLEVHLLVPSLHPESHFLEGNWRSVLANDLLLPSFKVSFLEAIARRLTTNYIWLFLGLLGGWILRVATSMREDIDTTWLYTTAGAFVVSWIALIFILLATRKTRHATGEIRRRDPKAKQWPI